MTVRILIGDCREKLRELPDASVNCCVTSPPYFGLRDYGCEGQMGLEPTPDEFVAGMVAVFREVRRVLRDDGTLWLNIGDSYGGGGGGDTIIRGSASKRSANPEDTKAAKIAAGQNGIPRTATCLPAKNLLGIPWRLALALQSDGWILRQDIIWSKPNPMPESVRDRCTKAHEYIFLLSKRSKYHYDSDAIAETAITGTVRGNVETRNKRSVWEVITQPFSEAHFATFPPALIEPCILAGCPKGGTVLDPFFGAGTTGLVADRIQRHGIGIELNPEYAEIARKRLSGDGGLFTEVLAA